MPEDLAGLMPPRLFRALCDPSRVAILAQLAESPGPRTVGDIASLSPVCVSVVSRHLATLREAGVLEAERRGKEVLYTVRSRALAQRLRDMADALEACCSGRSKKATRRKPGGQASKRGGGKRR